jgi:dynein heavy chain
VPFIHSIRVTHFQFEEMITKHKNIEEEVRNLSQSMSIGWLKVDARPLKAAVLHIASKWTNKFQQFLLDDLVASVSDISAFIESQSASLAEPVQVGNVDAFYLSMSSLKDIRIRGDRGGSCTQENFDAMKNIVVMLKKHGVKTPDEVLLGLEQAPQLWSDLQKSAILKRESLGPMQNDEIIKVRRKVNDFDEKWANFYVVYKNAMPSKFSENFEEAYSIIDLYHHGPASDDLPLGSLVGIQKTVAHLNGLQELFELNVTEYREIKQAVDQAIALKEVWDMVSLVLKLFDEWKKQKWNDIGVEVCEKLQEQAKSLAKDVKNMSRGAKIWSAHKGVEDTVKNMQTTLPLITDLKNPAMRERHWKQLARATGVSFSMDERFTFGDLMALKLHNFVDDVGEIVDRASKELNIEKQLKKIADAWIPLVIEFVLWQEGNDLQLLQVPENVVEALEENVVLLQNLQASKYVQGNAAFLEEVTKWQRKLGNVDSCLTSWRDVQTKWSNLQSIFVGSADIRVQLPEDSKRFDGIDAEFKELQREATMTPNVVEACNFEGRIDRIEAMLGLLEQCEKALSDYLETKRIAYPRFYFVSSADLIDILSKGSNPHSIMKHMPKCFDNVATFEFSVDKDGNKTKDAIGMFSKEREYVPFHESFKMEGAVENYLREITHHTHVVIVRVMADAVAVAEDKPRHEFM